MSYTATQSIYVYNMKLRMTVRLFVWDTGWWGTSLLDTVIVKIGLSVCEHETDYEINGKTEFLSVGLWL